MNKLIDLTGKKYGRLLVLSQLNDISPIKWLCRCECGNKTIVEGSKLKSGHTKSCGCLKRETPKNRLTTHGKRHTKIYRIWCAMKWRCKSNKDYFNRGITVCDEWKDNFQAFYDWAMSHGYSDNLTIDRINVNGNYEPSNCRWATIKEQANNKRNNHLITYNNKTQSMAEWADELGINYSTLKSRLNRDNLSFEEAIRKENLK